MHNLESMKTLARIMLMSFDLWCNTPTVVGNSDTIAGTGGPVRGPRPSPASATAGELLFAHASPVFSPSLADYLSHRRTGSYAAATRVVMTLRHEYAGATSKCPKPISLTLFARTVQNILREGSHATLTTVRY